MFTETDYEKLRQIMEESSQKKELLSHLLESHRIEVSSISHEIRNPLTLVYSTLQLIESEHPEVHTFKHWDCFHQDIKYMTQLLEELSSYNNSERLSVSAMDTEAFLQSLVLSFASSLTDTDIEFTSQIEPGLPVIQADFVKLRAVLLNLLKNAREAVSQNNTHPCITLHAYLLNHISGNELNITICDNGVGIPPQNLTHIFEPFITYKKNGTGLGLPIAQRIARAHGGTLTVSSVPGINTTFTLTIPV